MSVSFREATHADVDTLMLMELELFGTDAWSRDNFESEIDAPWTHYLVAVDEGSLVAYGGVSVPSRDAPADIQTIAVRPSHRRQGVARDLLLRLLDEARRRGATECLLEVRADNPGAQALYKQLGFERIAIRPRYYQPDDVDAWVMRAALSGGVS